MIGDKKFDRQVDRNLKGIALEKSGNVIGAERLYQVNVDEATDAPHPYERLSVIYTRKGEYKKAIKVIDLFFEYSLQHPRISEQLRKRKIRLLQKVEKENKEKKSVKTSQTPKEEKINTPSVSVNFETNPTAKKGKAKYIIDGKECFVEEAAIHYYSTTGYNAMWTENHYWWMRGQKRIGRTATGCEQSKRLAILRKAVGNA